MLLSKLLCSISVKSNCMDVEIAGITNNTDEIKENYLYVCITGTSTDGHLYASEAIKKGAVAVICEREVNVKNRIIVENSGECYAKLCMAFYGNPQKELRIIGITGTNGKTSTACIIKSILEAMGKKCGYVGTIENDTGGGKTESVLTTPDAHSLAELFAEMVKNNCEYAVIEASSHALTQNRLACCDFEIAVFTNLTPEHLDYHKSMENYLNAKKQLFYSSKKAVMNMDDKYFEQISEGIVCELITCSIKNRKADYMAENIVSDLLGVRYELMAKNELERIYFTTPGKISVYNTQFAIAVCRELGFSLSDIAEAVKKVEPIKGRLEIIKTDKDFGVIIDYAHTPDGMYNALKTVKSFTKGKLRVIFGCGGDRDKSKRASMGEIASFFADDVIITSDNPRTENPDKIISDIVRGAKNNYRIIENREFAIKTVLEEAEKDDIILLLGKGHETYQIIGKEKRPFDERKIIQKYIGS